MTASDEAAGVLAKLEFQLRTTGQGLYRERPAEAVEHFRAANALQDLLSERQRFMKALEQVKALCGFDSPVMDAWDAARKWLKDNGDTGASMPRDIMEGGISAFYEVADEALSPTPGPRP